MGIGDINFGDYWKDSPDSYGLTTGVIFNAGWMVGVMTNRMQIYGIGLDAIKATRSDNCRIERQMIDLARYPRYEQRWWERNVGWNYLQ